MPMAAASADLALTKVRQFIPAVQHARTEPSIGDGRSRGKNPPIPDITDSTHFTFVECHADNHTIREKPAAAPEITESN